MFYSQFILAKKGPLGTIWIAAHLERKLRKNQVADTDIGVSVDSILFPEVPIALRLSSHLLLGVVRIYSRKVNYLFDDCSEALLKIKQAFRSSAVDLPPEESTAPYHSITLPETFDLDDFELPDNDIFQGNYIDHHVSTREQITLQDTMDGVVYSTSQFGLDERFGDGDASQVRLDLEEDLFLDKVAAIKHDEVSKNEAQASSEPMEYARTVASHERMTGLPEDMWLNGTRNKLVFHSDESALQCEQNEDLETSLKVTDNAQSPSSSGLVEGLNVSSVKECLVWNDCIESEYQNVRAFGGMEVSENFPSKLSLHHGNDAMDCSTGSHLDHDTSVCRSTEEYRQLSVDSEVIEGQLLSAAVATERGPADESVSTLDGSHKVQDKTEVLSNNEQTINHINGDCGKDLEETDGVEFATKIEESLSDGKAVDQIHSSELPTVEDLESLNDHVSNEQITGILQPCNMHASQPEILSDKVDNSVLASDLQSVDVAPLSLETLQKEEGFNGYRPPTEVQGEENRVIDGVQSWENQTFEPLLNVENQTDGGKHDPLGSAIFSDNKEGSPNSSTTCELPAPEKLLSPPHALCDKPYDLFVDFPDKEAQEEFDGSGAGTNISGKKRSFTESSLTVDSLNSVESFGVTRSKTTVDSVPDDDDLLSSILVGRKSSLLKMKPTPAAPEVEMPSMKRARSMSRPSALKRKVLMDDLMVLHGDTIRQQLTNTEDIRRLRKKAPCTLAEILMIQRQYLEEEIFSEPVLTGTSLDLTHLHGGAFDLRGMELCKKYGNDSTRQIVAQDGKMEASSELIGCRSEIDGQTFEVSVQTNNHQVEDCSGSDNIDAQVHINGIANKVNSKTLEHELLGERNGMQILEVNSEVAAAAAKHSVLGLETSQSDPVPSDIIEVPSGSVDQLAVMERRNSTSEAMQIDTPSIPSHEIDDQLIKHVACLRDTNNDIGIGVVDSLVVQTEEESGKEVCEESSVSTLVEIRTDKHPDGSVPTDDADAFLANASSEAGDCIKFGSARIDQALEESQNNKHVVHSDDRAPGERSIGIDDKDQTSNFCSEEALVNSTNSKGLEDFENTMINDQNSTVCQIDDEHNTTDAQKAPLDHATTGDYDDIQRVGFANDTEFLNADDDEIDEDDERGLPNAEDSRLLENSGWSSRTRAVAKYLQNLFDKEAEQGRKVLLMNNLLTGKTRKEASRMFFETLVLKTKDYVHVDQAMPFDNINIKSRAKLMKSNF